MLWTCFLASLGPILLPLVQFGTLSIVVDKHEVNQDTCTCSCWDNVFKAGYESGIASYKHLYFNCTYNTAVIWVISVIFFLGIYEAIKYIIDLYLKGIFFQHSIFNGVRDEMSQFCVSGILRKRILILLAFSIYPHLYSWWMYFNYYNDEFYEQFWHQMLFTVTELISTLTVLTLASEEDALSHKKLLLILSIGLSHILISSWDQFVINVIRGHGEAHQVLRDVGFMLSDVINVSFSLYEFHRERRLPSSFKYQSLENKDLLKSILIILGIFFINLVL